MTEFLTIDGGTIAYDVTGADGPLVVLAHGMGDSRDAFRFLVPPLVEAGYRVARMDLRGHGESSVEWPSYTRTDIAGDILALVRHLGGPALLVGHSVSGGAVTIAAAQAPELVTAVVEFAPFTRAQSYSLGDFGVARFRTGVTHLMGMTLFGSVTQWVKYLDVAYPGPKPTDYAQAIARISAKLREPGRMKALQTMSKSKPVDAGAQLGNVRCPVLIVQGSLDPDWADPRAEGDRIVADLPAGRGEVAVIEGAGHYAHAQFPAESMQVVLPFLAGARA